MKLLKIFQTVVLPDEVRKEHTFLEFINIAVFNLIDQNLPNFSTGIPPIFFYFTKVENQLAMILLIPDFSSSRNIRESIEEIKSLLRVDKEAFSVALLSSAMVKAVNVRKDGEEDKKLIDDIMEVDRRAKAGMNTEDAIKDLSIGDFEDTVITVIMRKNEPQTVIKHKVIITEGYKEVFPGEIMSDEKTQAIALGNSSGFNEIEKLLQGGTQWNPF